METKNLDFDKLKCKHHPLEFITNYCLNDDCMIELCARCICSHTDMHIKQSTSPNYKSIKDIQTITMDQINQYSKKIQSNSRKIKNIILKVNQRKQMQKNLLKQAKNDIHQIIDKFFQGYFSIIQQKIQQQQQKINLSSLRALEQLDNKIKTQINNIIKASTTFNSNNFIDRVQLILTKQLPQIEEWERYINRELKKKQAFVAQFQYQKDYLVDIESTLRKLFTIKFTYNKYKYYFKENYFNTISNLQIEKKPYEFKQCIERPKSFLKNSILKNPKQRKVLANSTTFKSMNPCISSSKHQRIKSSLYLKHQLSYELQHNQLIHKSINIQNKHNISSVLYESSIPQTKLIF